MANFTRIEVFNKMNQTGLVPLFYNSDIEICKKVVTACYNGGARLLEFTARGDFAHEVFTDLNKFVIKKPTFIISSIFRGSDSAFSWNF